MSLDSAIKNVGDYYAAHYLADKNGFAKDIAERVKAWKAQGSQSAPKQLSALGDAYFRAKAAALDYETAEQRVRAENADLDRWHPAILAALGYTPEPFAFELATEQKALPVLHRLHRHNRPWLMIAEAAFCLSDGDNAEEPLEQDVLARTQYVEDLPTLQADWEKAIALVFKQEDAPRWFMLLAGGRIYLFDAHTYAQGRYLWVDLDEAYGRRQPKTFNAIAALLSIDALAPQGETDEVLHERLREGSLKSTYGVSEKLQSAVRDSIQAIANGWVAARRRANLGYRRLGDREEPLADGSREITAEQLRHDALIYVYRLLFCFYAEARGGELGILPINDEVYRLGYSLEALRDLVDASEPGTTTENGTYIAEHLERLFELIYTGFDPAREAQDNAQPEDVFAQGPRQGHLFGAPPGEQLSLSGNSGRARYTPGKVFAIQPLTATLFAPQSTPLLDRVRLPNRVLHGVIRSLSLGTSDKSKRIGRINYAELGIVQLGSVYEGLLSYKGFFATEDLIQVHPKQKGSKPQPMRDNAINLKVPTWFVPATRAGEFDASEIVQEHRTGSTRIYRTGEFILHLNGVDRVNSASYYTPAVLTRTLVEEALKERLKDFGPDDADDILRLTICEPAMGSAAFLVEAIDQLAHHYLTLKQKQLDRSIDPSHYEDELRRVRHYIAVHNVYGVDLNPVAVELGSLSLWLATIHRLQVTEGTDDTQSEHKPAATPWFGLRLRAGNSLIGARRSVWQKDELLRGKHYGKNAAIPRQLQPGEVRQPGDIYHFLVWDEDMAPAANDGLMKNYWPAECDAIKVWRNSQVKAKFTVEEVARLEQLSARIDELWQQYSQDRIAALESTACTATVWPTSQDSLKARAASPGLHRQESVKARLEAESGAFQRLKLLMDSWCSLYFWPLEQCDDLPNREAWLAAAETLLGIGLDNDATRAMLDLQLGNELNLEAVHQASGEQVPDAAQLCQLVPWFATGRRTGAEQNFHHWELIFTEVLGPQVEARPKPGGFDLMFGNPPWLKVSWKDASLLSEFEPSLGVMNAKSATFNRERSGLLAQGNRAFDYRSAFESGEGSNVFLNDVTLYPALAGVQTNLYKNFIERSWTLLGAHGQAGLLHPEGVFDDPKGGQFRKAYYPRLKAHYQFKNELILFGEVDHHLAFSINVFSGAADAVAFKAIFNLYDPLTIARCVPVGDPNAPVPGFKNGEGTWETRGHPQRLLTVTVRELQLFAALFEDEATALEARLPQVHSQTLLKVAEKFAYADKRLRDLKGQYYAAELIHEANGQRDGLITRTANPSFQPASTDEWVISGPHFYVGNPFNKTARTSCTANGHYDAVDPEQLPADYLPRAPYRPGDRDGNRDAFYAAIAEWPKPRKPGIKDGTWQPGFWPVAVAQVAAVEALLGEPLQRYGIDTARPGAKTARQFGYFRRWEGDVEAAIGWLQQHNRNEKAAEFNRKFGDVRLQQVEPTDGQLRWLPKPLTAYPRMMARDMCQPSNERTLMTALMPAGATAIHTVRVLAMLDDYDLVAFAGVCSSIVADFYIKLKGRGHVHNSDLAGIVIPVKPAIRAAIVARTLALQCSSSHFRDFYRDLPTGFDGTELLASAFDPVDFSISKRPVLVNDLQRRSTQIEIDVLAALELDLTEEELIQIYSVQFPVMKAYEEADEYDSKGQRLPNTKRKDPGGTQLKQARNDHDGVSPLTVSWPVDNGNQTVTKTFYPPFEHVDRVADYRTAYRVFSEPLGLTNKEQEIA